MSSQPGNPESSKPSFILDPDDWAASRNPTMSLQARLEWSTISMLCGRNGKGRESQMTVPWDTVWGISIPGSNTEEVNLDDTRG